MTGGSGFAQGFRGFRGSLFSDLRLEACLFTSLGVLGMRIGA